MYEIYPRYPEPSPHVWDISEISRGEASPHASLSHYECEARFCKLLNFQNNNMLNPARIYYFFQIQLRN